MARREPASTPEPSYRWSHPAEWLLDKIRRNYFAGNCEELYGLLNCIVPMLDSDEIQDMFQAEMAADGYFRPERRES